MYYFKHIICIALLSFVSCKDVKQKQEHYAVQEQPKQIQEKPYANPAMIYGSSFAAFFQSIYRSNNYALMLAFTSERTLNRFGKAKVLSYYQHGFQFDYKLGQLSNITYAGDTILLTYSKAYIFATRRKIVVPCVVEWDSVKMLLTSLGKHPFE